MHIIESVSFILKTLTSDIDSIHDYSTIIEWAMNGNGNSQLLKLLDENRTNKSEREPCNQQKVLSVKL